MPDESYESYTEEPVGQFIGADTLDKIINRRDIVEDLVDSLKGIRRSRDGKILFQAKIPLLNDKGIEAMVRKLKGFLTANTILTNLDDSVMNFMIRHMSYTTIFDLRIHYREYGLKDTSEMSDVLRIVQANIIMALKAGKDALTLKQVTPTFKRIEQYKPEQRQSPSLLPSFGHRGA